MNFNRSYFSGFAPANDRSSLVSMASTALFGQTDRLGCHSQPDYNPQNTESVWNPAILRTLPL